MRGRAFTIGRFPHPRPPERAASERAPRHSDRFVSQLCTRSRPSAFYASMYRVAALRLSTPLACHLAARFSPPSSGEALLARRPSSTPESSWEPPHGVPRRALALGRRAQLPGQHHEVAPSPRRSGGSITVAIPSESGSMVLAIGSFPRRRRSSGLANRDGRAIAGSNGRTW
jgi:hypothetical protein